MTHIPADAAYLHVAAAPGVSALTCRRLAAFFPSWDAALTASDSELAACGLEQRSIAGVRTAASSPCDADALLAPYRATGIAIVDRYHPAYPPLLAAVPDAPAALFVRGDIAALSPSSALAVVGSRNHTDYGRRVAYDLVTGVARADVVIVSGLALGIDAIAHQAALDAGGRTVAVIGSGVDDAQIAPRSHLGLAHAIIRAGGAVVSEYPIGTPAAPYTFPQRNRIMAGLSHAVLVVEAARRSGTLITAHVAAEYGRDVLAVPGPVFSRVSEGTHALIRDGAKLAACVQDVLDELPAAVRAVGRQPQLFGVADATDDLSDAERRILAVTTETACHVDKIITLSKLETVTALPAIAMLELRRRITDVGGRHYIRTS